MNATLMNRIVRRLTRTRPLKDKLCVICEQPVDAFAPYRGGWSAAPPLMRSLEMVGSDLDNWSCPSCNSHDRERHLFLYLDRMSLLDRFSGADLLHFAPEKRLSKLLFARQPKRYVRGDLHPSDADTEKIDLLNISYPDCSFDIVIANHVLEHVDDDRRGLKELHRVLRPGGFAILQTPFSARLHSTWEDKGIDTDTARLQAFGQEDHVRLYGRDIFGRFEECGLVSHIQRHATVLDDIDPVKYGVNRDEPFFLFLRK